MFALIWPAGAIKNTWLRVTVKATPNTGLAAPDVFYFGNLVGETGDAATPLRVSPLDLVATRRNSTPTRSAALDSPYDHNLDGRVNALDVAAVRAGYGRALSAVQAPAPAVAARVTPFTPDEDPITAQLLAS